MGKKFIFELLDDCPSEFKGIMVFGLTPESQILIEPIPIEDLTPYTEPDLEQVRKEAYDKGYDDATAEISSDEQAIAEKAYQKGQNDLWEAMQKAIKMYCEIDNEVFLRVFYDVKCDWGESVLQALFKNTPQHLIDSIRKYEQEKEELGIQGYFKKGEEVIDADGTKAVVLDVSEDNYCQVYTENGCVYNWHIHTYKFHKTGRHFPEIAEVLQKMKE